MNPVGRRGFAGSGTAPDLVARRAGVYLSAMHGVTAQYLYSRLRFAPEHAGEWISDVCTMLIEGLTDVEPVPLI